LRSVDLEYKRRFIYKSKRKLTKKEEMKDMEARREEGGGYCPLSKKRIPT